MENNQEFQKVFSKKDIFALAFGAMIGWGWVVLTNDWILGAGAFGAITAFIVGGIMIFFVGLTYAELTAALPESGGLCVFTQRAMGWNAAFFSSWAIVLGYASVVAFEAVAFPSVLEYFVGPGYYMGYLYTIAGYDVYAGWLAVGVFSGLVMTAINYFGTKNVALFQNAVTVLIAVVGIMLFGGSVVNGDVQNLTPVFQNGIKGILAIAVMTPFMFMGFDVIPQAAEEMNVPYRSIGKILLLSVIMAIVWYVMIIFSTSMALSPAEISNSGIATADAMKKMFGGSDWAMKLLVLAGIGGILTSWNAFFVGGSRALYAMAERNMLPKALGVIDPKFNTPGNAILLIGLITSITPLFGKKMLTWLVNAGSLAVVVAYLMVALSFILLRLKEPNLHRPYAVSNWKFIGGGAVLMTGILILLCLPGFPAALAWPNEWGIILGWSALGGYFYWKAPGRKKKNEAVITPPVVSEVTETSI